MFGIVVSLLLAVQSTAQPAPVTGPTFNVFVLRRAGRDQGSTVSCRSALLCRAVRRIDRLADAHR